MISIKSLATAVDDDIKKQQMTQSDVKQQGETVETAMTNDASTFVNREVNQDLLKA